MQKLRTKLILSVLALATCASCPLPADLEEGFHKPPISVKPRTWMHAMSCNMSQVGMTKDLEVMTVGH